MLSTVWTNLTEARELLSEAISSGVSACDLQFAEHLKDLYSLGLPARAPERSFAEEVSSR